MIEEAGADKRKARTFANLDAHREALIEALQTAKERVVIVSPTISLHAIEHDSLEREVRDAVTRGAEVLIYTDEKLNLDPTRNTVREPAQQGRKRLAEAGASVFIVHNIHNKSLAIDNNRLIEGSFNWLSAVRVKGSATQKYERSFEFIGAEEEIALLLEDMNQRVISQVARSDL